MPEPRAAVSTLNRGLRVFFTEFVRVSQRRPGRALSVEGGAGDTDARRGNGVHARQCRAMADLRAAGVFYSPSFTVTRENFDVVTDGWEITAEQRGRMKDLVAVPWDEEPQGGCAPWKNREAVQSMRAEVTR